MLLTDYTIMIFRHFRFFIFISIVMISCHNGSKHVYTKLSFKENILDSIMDIQGTKLAVLSCLNCDCFRQEYILDYSRNGKLPSGYKLMADTNCIKMNFPIFHLPQKLLDNLSVDLYNLVFIKKVNEVVTYKVLKTSESNRIQKEADKFFSN